MARIYDQGAYFQARKDALQKWADHLRTIITAAEQKEVA
jgi:hypothetical protein